MPTMKRTQMYLPEDMLIQLRQIANHQNTTIAQIVRDAVNEFLKRDMTRDWENDTLWSMVGLGSSKEDDISANHDKYLYMVKNIEDIC